MSAPAHSAKRGRLVVLAAPSGAGKTSLVHALLRRIPSLAFSISYTTRPKRSSEQHGKDYFFVEEPEFRAMAARGAFLEHASVFDNLYGTSREQVDGLLDSGRPVLLEIDWQGARQVRESAPEAISVFVLPPSLAELERRLRGRKTDSEATIRRRLADALADMSHWTEFDHVIVNDELDAAADALAAVVAGQGTAAEPDEALRSRIAGILAGR
jgi:guanylate kinase